MRTQTEILLAALLATVSSALAAPEAMRAPERTVFPPPQSQRQLAPSAQLRTQSISDPEHFPVDERASVLQIGDSIAQLAEKLNNTVGMCACGIEPFSREASTGPIGQTSFKGAAGRRFAVSVVSFEYALNIHKSMARAFGRNESLDGCYARAHRLSYVLEKHGLLTGKITALGDFRVRDKRVGRGFASWRYHIAPVIGVSDGQSVSAWVLDPALFNEPVPINVWLGLLVHQKGSSLKEAYLTSRFVYHPNQKNKDPEGWDPADLADAKRTLRSLEYVSKITKSPGLVRLELAGLKPSLEPLQAHQWKKKTRTSDILTAGTRSDRSSPETSARP